MKQIPAFVIAAPKSNSGKTVVTLGLIQALVKRGLSVQPFKCGPDYIDPMHHSQVARCPSYNLDAWMASKKHVLNLFSEKASLAEVAVVEGVMGLFDGANKDEGSSAALARLLNIPVVLVVDAASMAYSAAPLLFGFKNFDPSIRIAGVIFNRVGSASHYSFLQQAAEDVGVRSLGYLPKDDRLKMESRYLGLFLPSELGDNHPVNVAAGLIEEHIKIDELLEVCQTKISQKKQIEIRMIDRPFKVAFDRDEAFNFSYQANIDRLNELGDLHFFSPLHDDYLPEADLVWLPGGYPELSLSQLSQNKLMMQQIRQHAESGKALLAECGGMMYLGNAITDQEGCEFPMIGLFDLHTSFQNMKLQLGYRQICTEFDEWRGHEFHFSKMKSNEKHDKSLKVKSARDNDVSMPIYRKINVWGSYLHLYLGEKEKMKSFLNQLNINIK